MCPVIELVSALPMRRVVAVDDEVEALSVEVAAPLTASQCLLDPLNRECQSASRTVTAKPTGWHTVSCEHYRMEADKCKDLMRAKTAGRAAFRGR